MRVLDITFWYPKAGDWSPDTLNLIDMLVALMIFTIAFIFVVTVIIAWGKIKQE